MSAVAHAAGDVAAENAVAWISAARPEAPERLVARVRAVLAAHPEWANGPVADALVGAAESLLRDVLRDGEGPARDRALDLLAADACITWAFEVVAEDPASVGARARSAMDRLAKVVGS